MVAFGLDKKGHRCLKSPSCGLVFDPNNLLLTTYVISIFTINYSNVKLKLLASLIGIQDLIGCVIMAEMRRILHIDMDAFFSSVKQKTLS